MIWVAMSAGVGPLCFFKTNVTAPVYQDILEHFMLPSADQPFKDADKQKEPLPSIEYIYSKLTYFLEGQQFTKNVFFIIGLTKYSNLLR